MKRRLTMKRWLTGLMLIAVTPALSLAKGKKETKPLTPIAIQLENRCSAPLTLQIGELEQTVPPEGKSEKLTLQPREDWSFPVALAGAQKADLGLLSLEPGGDYTLSVARCQAGSADVTSHSHAPRPAKLSPAAAAQVRFRGRQNLNVEYLSGTVGRFMPLSVAMTRYKEAAAGPLEFTFRLRAARNGPVLGTRKASVTLEAGHKYLVEANVVGRDVFFKFEDEGWVDP